MKKTLLSLIISAAILLTCFAFGACNSNGYQGKEFVLENISAAYDDTVTEDEKNANESEIKAIKDQISSNNAPYCRFYTTMNILLTNCNGEYRFSQYTENGGNVQIDKSTTVDSAKNDKSPTRKKFFCDSSLENAVFSKENDKLVLTESNEGVTLKYVFAENGNLDESADNLTESDYIFADLAYTHYPTNEANDNPEKAFAQNAYHNYLTSSVGFFIANDTPKCSIIQGINSNSYDYRQGQNNPNVISYGNSSNNYLWVYGDLLIRQIQNNDTYNLGHLFYIKVNK